MFKVYLELEVRDKYGRRKIKRRCLSRSFVRQYLDFLRALFLASNLGANAGTVKRIDGTDQATPYNNSASDTFMNANGGAGDTNRGIVVGSDQTPVDPSQYDLAAPIAHGSGAGQLSYGAMQIGAVTIEGQTQYFEMLRSMSNQSGGTVTVAEAGVRLYRYRADLGFTWVHLIIRDVFNPIALAAGDTLTVKYKFQVTA